jgi:hypothetical protein
MQTKSITKPSEEIITIDAVEILQNEWFLEDMPDLPEDEMEAELKMWWSGRELA